VRFVGANGTLGFYRMAKMSETTGLLFAVMQRQQNAWEVKTLAQVRCPCFLKCAGTRTQRAPCTLSFFILIVVMMKMTMITIMQHTYHPVLPRVWLGAWRRSLSKRGKQTGAASKHKHTSRHHDFVGGTVLLLIKQLAEQCKSMLLVVLCLICPKLRRDAISTF
jgi:hypothetical protein